MKNTQRLQNFIDLVSNVMEAYTTALFLVDEEKKELKINTFQTFSKAVDKNCVIKPGEGLIGWVYREQKNILATNFDRSTTTLKFYKTDEEIKSFMAVPLPEKKGVMCVDSKKSYLFTDTREKIFMQMAAVALSLVEAERERRDRDTLHTLLKLSTEVDEIIISPKPYPQREFIKKIFETLAESIHLSALFFVVPGKHYYQFRSDNTVKAFLKELEKKTFSQQGLLGWVIKNRKNLILEKILENNDKSYVFCKNEHLENYNNFVGIYLNCEKNGIEGGIGFIKRKNNRWDKKEIQVIETITKKFFYSLPHHT